MKVFYTAQHSFHDPRHFLVNGALQANPEVPARAEALLAAVDAAGLEISPSRPSLALDLWPPFTRLSICSFWHGSTSAGSASKGPRKR